MENTLQESIRQAIENGQLDKMMSVFRMEAVKQKIEVEALQQMIEKESGRRTQTQGGRAQTPRGRCQTPDGRDA